MNINMMRVLLGMMLVLSMQGCWAEESNLTVPKVESLSASDTDTSAENGKVNGVSGSYKLIKGMEVLVDGKIYPICEDLLKSLNSFPEELPMVCERKFNAELGFTTPDWQPVKTEDIDWEILKQIYFSKKRPVVVKPENESKVQARLEKSWPGEKKRLEALVSEKTILWYAEFDIDNKEGREKVLMLKDNNCTAKEYFSRFVAPDPTLHVLNQFKNKLDLRYSRIDRTPFESFRYQGHTYLAKWHGNEVNYSGAQLFIYDSFMPQNKFSYSNKPICSYQYIQ